MTPDPSLSQADLEAVAEALADGACGCTGTCSNRPCEVDYAHAEVIVAALAASRQPVSGPEEGDVEALVEKLRAFSTMVPTRFVDGLEAIADELAALSRVPADGDVRCAGCGVTGQLGDRCNCSERGTILPADGEQPADRLREEVELFVTAAMDVLPLTGSWAKGYRLSNVIAPTVRALPDEWATAAYHCAQVHRLLEGLPPLDPTGVDPSDSAHEFEAPELRTSPADGEQQPDG